MLLAIVKLTIGIIILAVGADRFIDATIALAKRYKVPPLIAGVVLIGFGTSVPEIIVSSTAALKGTINIAIGNAIGSNIANIGLVLGVTGLIRALSLQPSLLKREFNFLWIITLIVGLLLMNHHLARWEGLVILALLALYLFGVIYLSKKHPLPETEPMVVSDKFENMAQGLVWLWWIVGLGLMLLGAEMMVSGAIAIARHFQLSELVIGLTVVAVGTALPELAASITAAIKGQDALVFGNVVGSNVFNTLAVIGVPAILAPGHLPSELFIRDYLIMVLFTAILWFFAWIRRRKGSFVRFQAGLLLISYLLYVLVLYYG